MCRSRGGGEGSGKVSRYPWEHPPPFPNASAKSCGDNISFILDQDMEYSLLVVS